MGKQRDRATDDDREVTCIHRQSALLASVTEDVLACAAIGSVSRGDPFVLLGRPGSLHFLVGLELLSRQGQGERERQTDTHTHTGRKTGGERGGGEKRSTACDSMLIASIGFLSTAL